MSTVAPSTRTTVRRLPERGVYERAAIEAILDEGLFCHVGFVVEDQPYVIPCVYARIGERLYLHGSPASRMLRALATGAPACATVTLLDGLVLARSAFHHSVNYRSVVILGTASRVDDAEERLAALRATVEHVVPGRWNEARRPSAAELAQTLVVALPIDEASAKVRSGGPKDDAGDHALDVWAGVVPLTLVAGAPIADSDLREGIAIPAHALRYERPRRGEP
ncbi:MAG: putative flavin-nucleotide-binding protein [Deltaproteobacteria bacterium]|nr:putative flavin-nucleotide-binding protein [Deltaproteobacteria bacterium]